MSLRVLYVAPALPPDVGGIERLAVELLPRLRDDHGMVIQPLSQYGLVSRSRPEGFAGFEVERIGETYGFMVSDPARVLRGRRRVKEIIAAFAPDLINLNSFDPLTWMVAHANPGVPVLLTLHNSEEPLRSPDSKELFSRHCTGLVAVSRSVEGHTLETFPSLAGRSEVIPNAMSLPNVTIETFPERPVVFFAGRIEPQKGADLAVRMMPRLLDRFPDARLVMAGGGHLEHELVEQIAAARLGASIEWLGRIEREEVLAHMARSSLVLVPSRTREGFSLAALEAAQVGRPVVGTLVDGLPETVVHGETGILVEPERPDLLADAVATVLADPALQRRLGAAGRARAQAEYSPAAMAAAHAAAMHRAATAGVRP